MILCVHLLDAASDAARFVCTRAVALLTYGHLLIKRTVNGEKSTKRTEETKTEATTNDSSYR